jgi:hypothetical protein
MLWGAGSGLRLTLDINKKDYIGSLSQEAGVRVSIHAPGELPYPQADGFNVPNAELTEIGLRYKVHLEPLGSKCLAISRMKPGQK